MRILIDVVDACGIEERGSPLNAMNLIAFREKKIGKISAVLSSDSRNKGFLQTGALLLPSVWAYDDFTR